MEMQFAVDLILIARCLGALVWGILWAVFLQYHRLGRFLVAERTWITVVIGVGVDLLLGIGATWWALWLVVVFSSVGIIARSLLNEHAQETEPALNRYKTKWQMEDTLDECGDIIGLLDQALTAATLATAQAHVSQALAKVHHAQRLMTAARYGGGPNEH